jgi:hypothetical protein
VFLSLIFSVTKNCYGQAIYRNQDEYDMVIKTYNDKWVSYENYRKKLDFYANFKYRKGNYPQTNEDWIRYIRPMMEKQGIFFDNHLVRVKSSVQPDGTVFVNFFESSTSNYLIVTCTEKEPDPMDPKLVYYATMYKFNHPGKPPVYVKPSRITPIKKRDLDNVTITTDTILTEPIVSIPTQRITSPSVEITESVDYRTFYHYNGDGGTTYQIKNRLGKWINTSHATYYQVKNQNTSSVLGINY